MVGIVIVSHSQKLAEGVKELAEMMAREVQIAVAGGLEDGMCGVSYERINDAVEEVCGRDGAVIFGDMGSVAPGACAPGGRGCACGGSGFRRRGCGDHREQG